MEPSSYFLLLIACLFLYKPKYIPPLNNTAGWRAVVKGRAKQRLRWRWWRKQMRPGEVAVVAGSHGWWRFVKGKGCCFGVEGGERRAARTAGEAAVKRVWAITEVERLRDGGREAPAGWGMEAAERLRQWRRRRGWRFGARMVQVWWKSARRGGDNEGLSSREILERSCGFWGLLFSSSGEEYGWLWGFVIWLEGRYSEGGRELRRRRWGLVIAVEDGILFFKK